MKKRQTKRTVRKKIKEQNVFYFRKDFVSVLIVAFIGFILIQHKPAKEEPLRIQTVSLREDHIEKRLEEIQFTFEENKQQQLLSIVHEILRQKQTKVIGFYNHLHKNMHAKKTKAHQDWNALAQIAMGKWNTLAHHWSETQQKIVAKQTKIKTKWHEGFELCLSHLQQASNKITLNRNEKWFYWQEKQWNQSIALNENWHDIHFVLQQKQQIALNHWENHFAQQKENRIAFFQEAFQGVRQKQFLATLHWQNLYADLQVKQRNTIAQRNTTCQQWQWKQYERGLALNQHWESLRERNDVLHEWKAVAARQENTILQRNLVWEHWQNLQMLKGLNHQSHFAELTRHKVERPGWRDLLARVHENQKSTSLQRNLLSHHWQKLQVKKGDVLNHEWKEATRQKVVMARWKDIFLHVQDVQKETASQRNLVCQNWYKQKMERGVALNQHWQELTAKNLLTKSWENVWEETQQGWHEIQLTILHKQNRAKEYCHERVEALIAHLMMAQQMQPSQRKEICEQWQVLQWQKRGKLNHHWTFLERPIHEKQAEVSKHWLHEQRERHERILLAWHTLQQKPIVLPEWQQIAQKWNHIPIVDSQNSIKPFLHATKQSFLAHLQLQSQTQSLQKKEICQRWQDLQWKKRDKLNNHWTSLEHPIRKMQGEISKNWLQEQKQRHERILLAYQLMQQRMEDKQLLSSHSWQEIRESKQAKWQFMQKQRAMVQEHWSGLKEQKRECITKRWQGLQQRESVTHQWIERWEALTQGWRKTQQSIEQKQTAMKDHIAKLKLKWIFHYQEASQAISSKRNCLCQNWQEKQWQKRGKLNQSWSVFEQPIKEKQCLANTQWLKKWDSLIQVGYETQQSIVQKQTAMKDHIGKLKLKWIFHYQEASQAISSEKNTICQAWQEKQWLKRGKLNQSWSALEQPIKEKQAEERKQWLAEQKGRDERLLLFCQTQKNSSKEKQCLAIKQWEEIHTHKLQMQKDRNLVQEHWSSLKQHKRVVLAKHCQRLQHKENAPHEWRDKWNQIAHRWHNTQQVILQQQTKGKKKLRDTWDDLLVHLKTVQQETIHSKMQWTQKWQELQWKKRDILNQNWAHLEQPIFEKQKKQIKNIQKVVAKWNSFPTRDPKPSPTWEKLTLQWNQVQQKFAYIGQKQERVAQFWQKAQEKIRQKQYLATLDWQAIESSCMHKWGILTTLGKEMPAVAFHILRSSAQERQKTVLDKWNLAQRYLHLWDHNFKENVVDLKQFWQEGTFVEKEEIIVQEERPAAPIVVEVPKVEAPPPVVEQPKKQPPPPIVEQPAIVTPPKDVTIATREIPLEQPIAVQCCPKPCCQPKSCCPKPCCPCPYPSNACCCCPPIAWPGACGNINYLPKLITVAHSEGTREGFGHTTNYTTVGLLFAPRYTPGKVLPMLDLRGHRFDNDTYAANVGLIGRYIPNNVCFCKVLGFNAYYDYREGCFGPFHQVGFGIEVLGKCWDFRANAYAPFGPKKHVRKCVFDQMGGGFKAVERRNEFISYAFNAEIGTYLLDSCDWLIYAAAGPYYLAGGCDTRLRGGRIRFRPQYQDYIAFDMSYSYDSVYRSTWQAAVIFYLPLYQTIYSRRSRAPCCDIYDRQIYQNVERFQIIPTGRRCCWDFNWDDED